MSGGSCLDAVGNDRKVGSDRMRWGVMGSGGE